MDKLFSRFRRRLMIEAIGKAALMGALIGSSIELAFLIVMHLFSHNPGIVWISVVFAVPFAVAFGLFFGLAYYPTQKRVARRIDASGLQERAGTMLQFRDQSTPMIELQRSDATWRIQQTETKKVRFAFNKRAIVSCLLVMALSIGCLFVPYDIMSIFAKEEPETDTLNSEWVQQLVEELKEKVENADVSEEIKDRLDGVIDELEEDLKDAETELEQVGDINKAETKIESILKEYLTKYSIGQALQKFESTKELGKAIEKGDTDGVINALDYMEDDLISRTGKFQSERLDTIASNIAEALQISGVADTDGLYKAVNNLGVALSAASDKVDAGKDANVDIKDAIEKAKVEINAALEEQAKIEEVLKDLENTLEDAKEEILGTEGEGQEGEGEEGEEGQEGEGEQPGEGEEGEGEEGEKPEGSGGQGGEDAGEGNDSSTNMTEGVYDPIFGDVEYGKVFATYYAEYLASLKEGEIPEDMQTILDRYFESLNK